MPIVIGPAVPVLDCADPMSLAQFYSKATGWDVAYSDADAAQLTGGDTVRLSFQRIEGYRAPGWPETAAHAHLDFTVDDVDSAVTELRALGASLPDFQPGAGAWTVLLDPEGHPFCIATG